ncbi:MAG: Spx/MgsR family RNA polymerase-binding regulatory protein [Verrucomicrobiota bacterium]
MKLYIYKGCDSCRKAIKWLRAREISFEEIPIREIPPSLKELKKMLVHYDGDIRRLFNTAGGDYRELNLKETLPGMPEAKALLLLSERGNLVKRPFLLGDSFGLVGFKEEIWADKLGE